MSYFLTTREEVKTSLDIRETARANAQVDRLNAGATDSVEGLLKRTFAPVLDTRTFDWPDEQGRGTVPWRIWLNQNTMISLVSATSSGGVTIPTQNVLLRPDWGPPFTRVELDRSSISAFSGGATPQRAVSFTALWGDRDDTGTAGALAAAVVTTTATTVTVTNAAVIGVGQLIRVDDERMTVTDRASTSTGTTLVGALTASAANTSVPVVSGALVNVGEVVTLGSERMMVDDVTGNTLVVRRAYDGSVLATHSNNTVVYAPRLLTVQRAAGGTTAATHTTATPITKWVPRGLLSQLARAYIMVSVQDEAAGYARVAGAESATAKLGDRLHILEARALETFGRLARFRTV
jgi:hypothetical protein